LSVFPSRREWRGTLAHNRVLRTCELYSDLKTGAVTLTRQLFLCGVLKNF
jgi:hypothetical protein